MPAENPAVRVDCRYFESGRWLPSQWQFVTALWYSTELYCIVTIARSSVIGQ